MDGPEPNKTFKCEVKTQQDSTQWRDDKTLAKGIFEFVDCGENIKNEIKEEFDPLSVDKNLSKVIVIDCEETIKEEIKEEVEIVECTQIANPIEEMEHDGKEECTYCKKRFSNIKNHYRNSARCNDHYQKLRQKFGYFDAKVQCVVCKKKVYYLNQHLRQSRECKQYSQGYHGYFRGVDWKQECRKCNNRYKDLYIHLKSNRECKQHYQFNAGIQQCKFCGKNIKDMKQHLRKCQQRSKPNDGMEQCLNCKKRYKNLYDHLRSNEECKPDVK